MGRMLGAFDPDDQLDRPDLNKCPDCGCYFATDECPLCGKLCPPDMRAGARSEPKKKKKTHHSTGRVTFVPWYHSWWFILIMMFVMPIAGLVLFITSPYSRKWKIIITSIAVVGILFAYSGVGFFLLQSAFSKDPVNTKLSRDEYMQRCQAVDADDFYRTYTRQEGAYFALTLMVQGRFQEYEYTFYMNDSSYRDIYVCVSPEDPDTVILVRDCQVTDGMTFKPGDQLRIYGQAAGLESIYNDATGQGYDNHPCLNMAYAELLR